MTWELETTVFPYWINVLHRFLVNMIVCVSVKALKALHSFFFSVSWLKSIINLAENPKVNKCMSCKMIPFQTSRKPKSYYLATATTSLSLQIISEQRRLRTNCPDIEHQTLSERSPEHISKLVARWGSLCYLFCVQSTAHEAALQRPFRGLGASAASDGWDVSWRANVPLLLLLLFF